ncbi:hypothetical protein [Nostoc sp.]|uniref:hypothetical protein n=1 Tax=Nostoc sp. TaxID=1180 RepID=UPI002FFAFF50
MSKSIFLTNRKGEAARSWGSQCVGRLRRLEASGVVSPMSDYRRKGREGREAREVREA